MRDFNPQWLDAKTVIYTAMDGTLRHLKSVGIDGVIKDFASDPKLDVHSASVSPDGKMVAYHKGDSEIWVSDVTGVGARLLVRGNFRNALDAGTPV